MTPVEVLLIVVAGLLTIAAATALAPRVRVAAPLLLVALGALVSLLPFGPQIEIEPEWILIGVLPPLLYSASVSMPSMDFRREFGAIGALSVVLVVISTGVIGLFFHLAIPGLPLAWGFALGAIVSPTDAVATSIVKRLGVSPRLVTLLGGESLLNDATALVLLRAAIGGATVSVSAGGVIADFAYAVGVAVVIGIVVGRLNLLVRERITDATVNTVISFTVPFLAAIPAEELNASGLVAAVVAGLVTGRRAVNKLSPQHRLSDEQNWRTVELVLEGAVFLLLGLELSAILDELGPEGGVGTAVWIAAVALGLTVIVRGAFVALLIGALQYRTERGAQVREKIERFQAQIEDPEELERMRSSRRGARRRLSGRQLEQFKTRLKRARADIDHLLALPLNWRDGTVVVWAGMRGAVTLAAAQTLPVTTPSRSLLILVAFIVAVGSLALQGSTLPRLVKVVKPSTPDPDREREEHEEIMTLLRGMFQDMPRTADRKADVLALLDAQRRVLLEARDDGRFGSETLTSALASIDADQISWELKGAPPDPSLA